MFKKTMFSKFKAFLIMVLAILCLTSIGFASWIFPYDVVNKSFDSNIIVDNVVMNKSNDYIYLKENSLTSFSFGEKGFIDENNNYVKNGTIKANYIINLESCKQAFNEFNSLKIKIIITYDMQKVSYNLFQNIENKLTFTSSIIYQNTPIIDYQITGINDYQYTVSFDLVDVLKNYSSDNPNSELEINYNWIIDDSSYFREYIFSDLYDKDNSKLNLEFSINATIEGM